MIKIEDLLDFIISDTAVHAKWLNTLSFMEHVGTRKIHRTQSGPALTDIILQHASEEARHAHFFKRMSEKTGPGLCPDYQKENLLAGYPAFRYFQSLDIMADRYVAANPPEKASHAFMCYLYVTTIIEERAGWMYPIYEERLKKAGSNITLQSVITEEEGHLEVMYDMMAQMLPDWQNHMEFFRTEERKLFDRVIDSVAKKAGFTGNAA